MKKINVTTKENHSRVATFSKGLSDKEFLEAYREIIVNNLQKEDVEIIVLDDLKRIKELLDLLIEYKDIIALKEDTLPVTPLQKFKIEVLPEAPKGIFRKQYLLIHWFLQDMDDFVEVAKKRYSALVIHPIVAPS